MLAIDLVILAAVLLASALVIGRVVGKRLEASRETRARREQGEANAQRERRRLEEVCVVCHRPVEPKLDIWERDEWWHKDCWRETVGETGGEDK